MYLKSKLFGLFLLVLAVAQGPFLRANTIVNYGIGTQFRGPTFVCDGITLINTDYYGNDTGYCFTGSPYTDVVSPYTTAMSLDIVLVTDVLAPNLPLTNITIPTDDAVAFDGVNVWAGGNIKDVSFDLIEVGTNELGQIDQWYIVVDGAGPLTGYTLTTSWDGTTGSTVISDGLLAKNLNDPGSWSEVSPTPEPSTGVDLALGLLALGALLIGKRRVAQAPRK
jgi:hypothetical protein